MINSIPTAGVTVEEKREPLLIRDLFLYRKKRLLNCKQAKKDESRIDKEYRYFSAYRSAAFSAESVVKLLRKAII